MRKLLVFTIFCLLFGATSLNAQNLKLKLDYIDGSQFKEKGLIKFYINFFNTGTYNIVESFDANDLKISANNKLLHGKRETKLLKDEGDEIALLVILTANNDYRTPLIEGKEGTSPFDIEKNGIITFLQTLKSNIVFKVCIYVIYEDVYENVVNFTDLNEAIGSLKSYRINKEKYGTNKMGSEGMPSLYNSIKRIISKEFVDQGEDLPYKKLVLVMSDGRDRNINQVKKLNKTIDDIRQLIEEGENLFLRIHTIFYTPSSHEGETLFAKLSHITGGIAFKIPDSTDLSNMNDYFEKFANIIKKQFLVYFFPEDLSGGEKYKFEIKYPGLSPVAYPEEIELPKRPLPWKKILIIVFGVLGGLIFLFILIKIIKGIMERRAEEEYEEDEDMQEFVANAKATLKVIDGPEAGRTFYITQVRMTIGKMEGNEIVIDDPTISRKHAAIRVENMRFELADLGSSNGTFVNGRRITKIFLKDGDKIKFGNTEVLFELAKK